MTADILSGLMLVMDPMVIFFIVVGVFIGIVFGSVPGLTATMAIVMFLPLTYTMSPVEGVSTLVALYVGGISGGLIAAILLNIPGTPSSIATTFDGAPMAAKGEAGKALGVGVVFSFCGTIVGLIVLVLVAPLLASVAIKFGPYEYCTLALFALSLVISLTGRDLVKGLISALIGVMLATVGLAPVDSAKRFTFGFVELNAGFSLLTLLIGLFAITEVIKAAEDVRKPFTAKIEADVRIKGFGFSMKEFLSQKLNMLRSSAIGIVIGILPGIGGAISGMLAYTAAKNQSKHPEKFGTGIMDGVVASESANNAGIGGAMIPLLTLGIPGDAATAMLLGGLMVHQIAPGPLIFDKSGPEVFGIFFAGEDSGSGMTMQTVVREINTEYDSRLDEIKNDNAFDVLEMSGSRAVWKEVLAVYSVKTTTDPDNPQEVATMDDNKKQLLTDIFWEMNEISSRTESKTETVITETDDGHGNIVQSETTQTRTYLYIAVSHKTAEEMADQYGFDDEQRQMLSELLADENNSLWSQVLYGISVGDGEIVTVALSQVGNIGGQPYWSWYGFSSRVEWCACFVSWCANECGYIENGVIPKFAGCIQGSEWFMERGQWQDGSFTPEAGHIIFFDWEGDGLTDHVGIVERVENGTVYTVEGNSGDACRQNSYAVGSSVIYGYGIPAY